MIYPFIRVDIPDISGYIQVRNGIRYFYAYLGERVKRNDGSTRHPDSKMLGRLEQDAEGNDKLVPNTFYYKLMGLEPPAIAVAEGPGRKPLKKGKMIKSRPEYSELSFGYGLSAMMLLAELGVIPSLASVFSKEQVSQICALAAFLCDGPHSSLEGLNDFVNDNLGFCVSPNFDRRRAGELLVQMSSEERGHFFTEWNKLHASEANNVFYDVTSFSTYSGQIMRASFGYNRDGEDLSQINEGLFCAEETGLPLFMCSYDGSLNDAQNFKYALQQAKAHKLTATNRKMTIIIDGGFSSDNFNWAHFEGYNLIGGVSALRIKKVKEEYLKWSRTLTSDAMVDSWTLNDEEYISARVPVSIGGVDGTLVMYRDINSYHRRLHDYIRERERKERELEECTHWKGKDFDSWAKSFAPYFKVRKSRNKAGFTWETDTEQQNSRFALCGKVTLFTTCKNLTDREIMELYRAKESVEDCFDTTKNGLSDKRLHVHGDLQVDGKMFALFIALILLRTLHYRAKRWQEQYNASVSEVIRELKKICYVKIDDRWILKDALTKRQKELLDCLSLKFDLLNEKEKWGNNRK